LINLGEGNRGFSQATVGGNEVLITTDISDVNAAAFGTTTENTGTLFRANLSSGEVSSVEIPTGAASVDIKTNQGIAFTVGGSGIQRTDLADFDNNGTSIEAGVASSAKRLMWLQTY
jgi:hypothetical protein